MKNNNDIDKILKQTAVPNLIESEHRQRLRRELLAAGQFERKETKMSIWKYIASTRRTKISTAAAAAILVAGLVLLTYVMVGNAEPAYALEQTGHALKSVRYMHITMCDGKGKVLDERWIEIDPSGTQGRYRQENSQLLIADDDKVCRVFHKDTDTYTIHNSGRYTWFSNLGELLRDLSGKGDPGSAEIQRDVTYKNHPAHLVRLVMFNLDCYIDPVSKLPVAIGAYDVSFGNPPEDTFDLSIPSDAKIVDKRSNQQGQNDITDDLEKTFSTAKYALVIKDYKNAEKLFKQVTDKQPGRNWAVFWLGRSYHEQGKYDDAIREYSSVIDLFKSFREHALYAYLARGFAYQKKDMFKKAKQDFAQALPQMIKGLRNTKASLMFDYADATLLQYRLTMGTKASNAKTLVEREKESTPRMIKRLRLVTGKKFGYDLTKSAEENNDAIAAWEKWWAENAKEYGVKPDTLKPFGRTK